MSKKKKNKKSDKKFKEFKNMMKSNFKYKKAQKKILKHEFEHSMAICSDVNKARDDIETIMYGGGTVAAANLEGFKPDDKKKAETEKLTETDRYILKHIDMLYGLLTEILTHADNVDTQLGERVFLDV